MAYVVGESSDKLTVETGKCIRITGYGREGPVGSEFCQTPAELARGSVVFIYDSAFSIASSQAPLFALRNSSSTRKIFIHSFYVQGYGQSGAVGISLRASLKKFRNVTGISGTSPTTLTPSIFKTSLGQATGVDAKVSSAGNQLVLDNNIDTGEISSSRLFSIAPSATVQAAMPQFLHLDIMKLLYSEPVQLVQNEAIAFISNFTTAPPMNFMGSVFFTEHAN